MHSYAIYDMDRTITRIGTFTPFLWFAAKRQAWRIPLLLAYFLALPGYPLGLLDRKALKTWGAWLILGSRPDKAWVEALAADYSAHVLRRNFDPATLARIAADKAEGCTLVLATASPDFYAEVIGTALGFDHVIATVQARHPDGGIGHRIASANCYGPEKLRRVEQWLPVARGDCTVRFYSDHHSDAPVFEWADQAIAVNPNAKLRTLAEQRGWTIMGEA